MENEQDEIDTMNKFLVMSQGGKLAIGNAPRGPISHQDALLLAAYLVSMVGDDPQWEKTLQAVQST